MKPKTNKIKEKGKSGKNKTYHRCLHKTKLQIISHLTTSPQPFTKIGWEGAKHTRSKKKKPDALLRGHLGNISFMTDW